MWAQTRPAFNQERCWQRAHTLALATLLGFGRHTISGMLTTSGQQFVDWSAAYRLFSEDRFDPTALFAPARRAVIEQLDAGRPLVALIDDTLLHKRGRHVNGTAWRRDPLGPPFATNLIWGQRFLQISAALPEHAVGPSRARAVPIDFIHCPTPKKPGKRATVQEHAAYKAQREACKISKRGAEAINQLRATMDHDQQHDRDLLVSVDGGYTNSTVLKSLPARTTLIGRVRKDAKLYAMPTTINTRGRKRIYGDALPTPEQMRQDATIAWREVKAHAAGRIFDFKIKTIGPLRWRGAGARDMQLIIVRPLGYRLTKSSKVLYRQPAYLLCSDPTMSVEQALQAYLWRWEIEVNFREEKTVLGCGEAQVRNAHAVERVPQLMVAAYAFLLLAIHRNGLTHADQGLCRPKWRQGSSEKCSERFSTCQGINLLRAQFWGKALGLSVPDRQAPGFSEENSEQAQQSRVWMQEDHFSDFMNPRTQNPKSDKFTKNPASAICYAAT